MKHLALKPQPAWKNRTATVFIVSERAVLYKFYYKKKLVKQIKYPRDNKRWDWVNMWIEGCDLKYF